MSRDQAVNWARFTWACKAFGDGRSSARGALDDTGDRRLFYGPDRERKAALDRVQANRREREAAP